MKVYQNNKTVTLKANRKVKKAEVYTLNGSKLTTVERPSGDTSIRFNLEKKGSAPVILVCYAVDGSYATRKIR